MQETVKGTQKNLWWAHEIETDYRGLQRSAVNREKV